ncbi:hypothetical protein Ssed_3697 [Shewanella sediminis HAW-EB3]|uniref:Uncharacterized protein n=1 Tax=Shewanella sediminis (strain HAW-EB3) TaxID=425104 RepID=A8FZM8_SHESH|nr:hypothetical protein [Shewanella sediminis]ABV38301.1 hypothetical protein Ssed_3697 [Shewanella sediminis HAW-EB3]
MIFDTWDTPFNEGELFLVNATWGGDEWSVSYPDGKTYRLPMPTGSKEILTLTLFHLETEAIYELRFQSASAFRVLDEGGLLDIWSEKQTNHNCFKVKGHGWSEGSPVSFAMGSDDGFSYCISTDDDCVEVVCDQPPEIFFKQKLLPVIR